YQCVIARAALLSSITVHPLRLADGSDVVVAFLQHLSTVVGYVVLKDYSSIVSSDLVDDRAMVPAVLVLSVILVDTLIVTVALLRKAGGIAVADLLGIHDVFFTTLVNGKAEVGATLTSFNAI